MICNGVTFCPDGLCGVRFPRIVATDKGLHNRDSFARGFKSNGVHMRQAGTEAPEQVGRGERHGGISKNMMKYAIKDHHVIGKDQPNHCASIAHIIKNESMRREVFSPAQWVLAKAPQGPDSLAEDDKWQQLGVLASQQCAKTGFGFKAKLRMSMRKAFVRMGCGRQYAASVLRMARVFDKK